MNLDAIKARIDQLKTAVDQSVANHNALVGRWQEAEEMLKLMEQMAVDAGQIVIDGAEVVADVKAIL